jgi:hypothetical protein
MRNIMQKSLTHARNTPRRYFAQKGTTLLEALAYLGIAALVILGAIALLVSAFSGADSNRGMQDVSTIRTGVKKLFSGQPNGYASLANSTLDAAKIFPSSLTVGANSAVTNQWGGSVTVAGTATNFTVTYGSVPRDVCVNMSTGNAEWSSVTVNGGSALTTPVTPASAASACSGATNSIVFTGV